MKNTVKINSVDLINADCLHFIQSLPDDSIDLIVTDPPYFKVKPNGWDNQWKGDEDYLKWLDHCLAQFWRVLKPAGSLYLFCGHRLASDIEIMMRERFNVLNHIIWAKPSGRWNGCNKESLRAYFPATERVLFAEHYQGPYRGKSDGYAAKERELKQHIMAPLISYFRDARAELGITAKQIAEATGKKNMVSHWFGASQWQLPNEADYRKLQALFSRIAAEKFQKQQLEQPHHQLVASYDSLNRKYSELLDEFKSLRRYFSVSVSVPYTDVWMHNPVQFYPGKHPCEKPADTRAWTYRHWMGTGTVGVMIASSDLINPIPEESTETAARQHIGPLAPVAGSDLYVFRPVAHTVDFHIRVTPDTPEIRAAITAELRSFLLRDGYPQGELKVSRISEAISGANGEYSHQLLAPADNISIAKNELAVLGTISWT